MSRYGLGCLAFALVLAAVACARTAPDAGTTSRRVPTSVPPTAAPPPAGWLTFNSGAFSGAIAESWRVVSTADNGYLTPTQLEALNPAARRFVEGSYTSADPRDVTFVLMDFDPAMATSIALSAECSTGVVRDGALTGDRQIIALQTQGIKGMRAGSVEYKNASFDLVALQLSSIFDSYEVYLRDADCYFQVGLTTRHGDTAPIEQFKQFLSILRADTSMFH